MERLIDPITGNNVYLTGIAERVDRAYRELWAPRHERRQKAHNAKKHGRTAPPKANVRAAEKKAKHVRQIAKASRREQRRKGK